MIVDYDGKIVAQATPGEGEKITVGPVDIEMLRYERQKRLAHQMLLHLRPGAHGSVPKNGYPGGTFKGQLDQSYEDNERRIEEVRVKLKA